MKTKLTSVSMAMIKILFYFHLVVVIAFNLVFINADCLLTLSGYWTQAKMSQGAGGVSTPSALQNGFNKVFIQRDYSEGTAVKFHTRLPAELEGLVSSILYFSMCKWL